MTSALLAAGLNLVQRRPPVSVLILTLDEEANLNGCLDSCAWCDDVQVLDSGSKDRTAEIAQARGIAVHTHPFESFGAQRNWAIDHVPMKHKWVFHLDADERFTAELVDEMAEALQGDPSEAGFYVAPRLMFMGRWLKRSGGYPVFQMRLFHSGRMRFSDYGHGQREATTGAIGRLGSAYLHYNFSKGLEEWLEKHNRYSSAEAQRILASEEEGIGWGELVGGDPIARRRVLKRIWYRLPCRPLLRWGVTLFVMGGILEGAAGRTYASLLAMYERMISLKVRFLRDQRRHADDTKATRP